MKWALNDVRIVGRDVLMAQVQAFLPARFSCFSEQSRFPDSLHVSCQDNRAAAIWIGHIWVNESNPGAERFSDLKKPLFVEKACRFEGLECL
jgi:hypothetical protein